MTKARKAKSRVKSGGNALGVAARREAFVAHYLSNGRNATQAAISAGYSAKTARVQGSQLLAQPAVRAMVEKILAKESEESGLTVALVQRELKNLVTSNIQKFQRADGSLIPIHELPPEVAATIASYEVETVGGNDDEDDLGPGRAGEEVIVRTKKLKLWDKNTAIGNAMRHLGMFEKDNKQRTGNVQILIQGVG